MLDIAHIAHNSRKKGVRIIEIRQKLTDQGPILISYFDNDANCAAVVKFLFWIKIRNPEANLVKMVCKLLKSVFPSLFGDDFGVLHWISAPNLEVDDDSSCLFLAGGPHFHCFLYDGTSKSTLKVAMSYMT